MCRKLVNVCAVSFPDTNGRLTKQFSQDTTLFKNVKLKSDGEIGAEYSSLNHIFFPTQFTLNIFQIIIEIRGGASAAASGGANGERACVLGGANPIIVNIKLQIQKYIILLAKYS